MAVPLLTVVSVLLGMAAVLTVSIAQLATLAPRYAGKFRGLVADVQGFAGRFGINKEQVDKAIASFDPAKVFELVQGLLAGLLGVASSLFLIVVLLLAMCLDAPVTSRVVASGARERPHLARALTEFSRKTRRYLLVSTVFGLLTALLDVVALVVLGIPLPLLWGVLAFITIYIPNIGFVIGLVPPAMLGLLEGGFQEMLLVVLAYCMINVVIQSLILPKFLGDAVGLSTTVTLLSLITWTFVLGPLGAILAIPLSLFVRALLVDSDPSAGWVAALISAEEPKPVGGGP
ncbi:hypothetical protein Ssi02_17070 [Sinosporangium siamense]|uniref:AI-2E family transporter n=1 Tax=Sinosporangium siamense TaxID=1367973 RepID=A0A919RCM3_9ACTN|nr:hypothetical protein Ssi02_17070 [Sinosporangium siamense]